MDVRLSLSALMIGALALAATLRTPETRAQAAADRPNIVVVMTDDQRLDTLWSMPKTLSLIGTKGVTFSNALVSFPVCGPSRATFLTGQYAHNHGVLGNAFPLGGHRKLDHSNTLPVWLRGAGYRTAFVGKYLNGYGTEDRHEIPPGWDDWQGLTSNRYYGFELNDNGILRSFGATESEYQTDVLAARARDVIRRHAHDGAEQPLFLYVATQAPHSGRNSDSIRDDPALAHLNQPFGARAARHLGQFADLQLPKTTTYGEKFVEDKPAHVQTLDAIASETTFGIEAHYRAKLEMLQAVDDLVEGVVIALAESGMADRTVLIFTSDNGFFHGEHRLVTGKQLPYDEALRVPLLVRGPGFPAGKSATQLVSNVDLAPTIVELAGAVAGREMDGRSLVRLANNPSSGRARSLLLESGGSISEDEGEGESREVDYRGLRQERHHYVEYETGEAELYYLVSDPEQALNRIDDSGLSGVRERLRALLRTEEDCRGRGCSKGTP
jgi:N-acetylglucosamine-6-sulfatase